MNSVYPSPLRYPGGKGRISNYVAEVMQINGLHGATYVEPFAGGAGVALKLLFAGVASDIHINDLNPAVAAFWDYCVKRGEKFAQRIEMVEISMAERERQREVLHRSDAEGDDLGFALFYLNRTNRSGIVTGGPIGGKEQSGRWGIDARFDRQKLAERVRAIHGRRTRIKVTDLDATVLLGSLNERKKKFIYLDPPYVEKAEDLYQNFLISWDHRVIAKTLANVNSDWMVSYDDVPLVEELYGSYDRIRYALSYSAQERRLGQEFMAFSHGLSIPDKSPTGHVWSKHPRSLVDVALAEVEAGRFVDRETVMRALGG